MYSGGNQAAGDHEQGQRSAGWTVWKKIYIEQESQDTASQPADNVYHSRNSRRQKTMEGVDVGIDGWNRLCDDTLRLTSNYYNRVLRAICCQPVDGSLICFT